MQKILPLIVLGLAASAHAQPVPNFTIACQLDGRHGTDTDRIVPDREIELLRDAVIDTYPQLPSELQDATRQATFMVNHNKKSLTKRYMGWSAEDDPDYRYPDTEFYPKGTIKANFTEKFIRTVDLGTQLGKTDPRAAVGIRSFWREVIAHELRHAWQYHTGPVRDLSSVADSVKDGLADEKLLAETKKKVAYEHQAYVTGRSMQVGHNGDVLYLAAAMESYANAHPDLFVDGAPFHLVALDAANPVVGRYLREHSKDINLGDKFNDSEKIIYEGQYVPAEIVLQLKKSNDLLETSLKTAAALNASTSIPDDLGTAELKRTWAAYMNAGKLSDAVKDSYPYLKDVEKRYQQELARREQLTGQR